MVNSGFKGGDKDALDGEMRRLFGVDLVDAKVVFDDSMEASGEYYAFVKCSNYQLHVDALMSSYAVSRVIMSYEAPSYLSDAEVAEFIESVSAPKRRNALVSGDLVLVTEGYLKGLHGIVLEAGPSDCNVAFRLCTKRFWERIPVTWLRFTDNVFQHLRIPVTEEMISCKRLPASGIHPKAREALIVVRRETYRKSDRKRPEEGRG